MRNCYKLSNQRRAKHRKARPEAPQRMDQRRLQTKQRLLHCVLSLSTRDEGHLNRKKLFRTKTHSCGRPEHEFPRKLGLQCTPCTSFRMLGPLWVADSRYCKYMHSNYYWGSPFHAIATHCRLEDADGASAPDASEAAHTATQ